MKRKQENLEPREETRKKMKPITRNTFAAILRKAAKTQPKTVFKKP
jgi:hypothetical protein